MPLFLLFAFSKTGHVFAGWIDNNEERLRDGAPALALASYLSSASFVRSVFETWESEFLQMGTYVILTAYLFQSGSPESKDPDTSAPQERDPELDRNKRNAPWPVRAAGFIRTPYAHSPGLSLIVLFLVSFCLHLVGSAGDAAEKAPERGEPPNRPRASRQLSILV